MQERAPNRKKVVIVGAVHPAGMRLLEARDDIDFEVTEDGSEANLIEKLKDADGVTLRAAKMTAKVIAAAERLRVVSRHGVGYDSVDIPALNARGIPLAIAINCNAVSVAEQVFAFHVYLITHGRQVCKAQRPLCNQCVLAERCPARPLYTEPAPISVAAGPKPKLDFKPL
jgi:phosphoglycerate dehydrogenase-like enzyme